jgi:hypothetical protein
MSRKGGETLVARGRGGASRQQVPRLRKIIRFADNLSPLGMTIWGGGTTEVEPFRAWGCQIPRGMGTGNPMSRKRRETYGTPRSGRRLKSRFLTLESEVGSPRFFRPFGAGLSSPAFYPRLAPWAAFFRRFAAGFHFWWRTAAFGTLRLLRAGSRTEVVPFPVVALPNP